MGSHFHLELLPKVLCPCLKGHGLIQNGTVHRRNLAGKSDVSPHRGLEDLRERCWISAILGKISRSHIRVRLFDSVLKGICG
jgi:hypothetical protein